MRFGAQAGGHRVQIVFCSIVKTREPQKYDGARGFGFYILSP